MAHASCSWLRITKGSFCWLPSVPSTPVEMVLDYELYDGEFAGNSFNVNELKGFTFFA